MDYGRVDCGEYVHQFLTTVNSFDPSLRLGPTYGYLSLQR